MPRGRTRLVLIIAIIAGIAAGIVMCLFKVYYTVNRFPAGVYIGEVAVGGKDRESACQAVGSQVGRLGVIPVVFEYKDFQYRCTLDDLGARFDPVKVVDDALGEIYGKYTWWKSLLAMRRPAEHPSSYLMPITYDDKKITAVLDSLRSQLDSPSQNCKISYDNHAGLVITPEVKGQSLNVAATLEKVPRTLGADIISIPIVIEETLPELRRENFHNITELAAYSTQYNSNNVDRSYNLTVAARALNGTVMAPGKEFSFNGVVGPREAHTGYREALVILGDEFAPGVGGGVCQVVSTLYNACLLSGLEITERHNHSVAISYVPVGLDATVNYGLKDFRFRNNTGGPLYLQAFAGKGRVTTRVFGPATFKKRIELERKIEKQVPFTVIEKLDSSVPPGETKIKQEGVPGYTVRSFRVTYDDKGGVISRETLARDVYRPLSKTILTGPPRPLPDVIPAEPEVPAEPGETTQPPALDGDEADTVTDTMPEAMVQ